ncbi:serine hydrolase domain-containing protein [Naumannella halotolerans]|uniref:serine hydrolase domain-containing protein n=1 Tax=Naumannella halotolerans TaxID=993414 RepID=UPI00370D93E6
MTDDISVLSGLGFVDPQADPHHRVDMLRASQSPLPWPEDLQSLEVRIDGAGTTWDLDAWRDHTHTTSLLLIIDDTIVHEWYAPGFGPWTRFLGASMTKSALSHLVGEAVDSGVLDLQSLVVDLVPELSGSGYSGVRVIDLLTMTSGVGWDEDYWDENSAASRLIGSFHRGTDSRRQLSAIPGAVEPGRRYAYCTPDSQVLDWARERATGTGYAEELGRLWDLLGATDTASVSVDGEGVALAGGGLAACTRDWARIAALLRDGSNLAGRRVLSTDWVEQAVSPPLPYLGVGRLPSSLTTHAGFGLHWWPMDDAGRRVTADGSRGQFAAIDRETGAVVVKTSLWPYSEFLVDRAFRDLSYLGIHALLDVVASMK